MLKNLVVGATGALLLMTCNAVADGMPRRAAVVPTLMPNWTGFYIGAGVGGAFTTHEHSANAITEKSYYETTVVDVVRLWDLENGRAHGFGTVTVGYDHLLRSHLLAGVFVDYDFGNGKNDANILGIGPIDDIRVTQRHDHAWSIGGRLGFLASPSTLLYLSTGWTQVSLERDISFWFDGTQYKQSFDKNRNGWFIGAGIETQLGWLHSGLSLRGEYRFTRLDDDPTKFAIEDGYCGYYDYAQCNRRLELEHDVDVHSVRVVLAYKFGRREALPAPLK